MQEIWKDVQGYEGYYKISNFGNVKSVERQAERKAFKRKYFLVERELEQSNFFVKEKELSKCKRTGYYVVYFWRNNKQSSFQIHRLVAIHFIENPLNKEMVNHLDGDKLNNHISNLEWVTVKENNQHAYDTGLILLRMKKIICETNGEVYRSITKASEDLKISRSCIRDVLNGKQKSSKGMVFKYYEET